MSSKIPVTIVRPGRRGPITMRKSGSGFHQTRKPRGETRRRALAEASA